MRCNHCTDAPCVTICPTKALFKRSDGIVDFDTSRCIGCKSCMQACPYDALYIDPDDQTAQKCNYCVHRVEVGIEPACVVVCPVQAIIAGDLDDPTTEISALVAAGDLSQRSLEQGTSPNLWYKGGELANLDPLGATGLSGGGIWRDTQPVAVSSAGSDSWLTIDLSPRSSDPAPSAGPGIQHFENHPPRVVYNTDHPVPWGWKVSSYFLTKAIAAGIVLALAVSSLIGGDLTTSWARWAAPLVAGVFLLLTGVLLVSDLKRPDRFHFLLTKGNPSSWLVRGAWILGADALLLTVWFLVGVTGNTSAIPVFIWIGVPLALASAGYTAFLFGQAEARDLWQTRTLLWHMLAGAFAAGGGASMVFGSTFYSPGSRVEIDGASPDGVEAFLWTLLIGVVALGVIAAIEFSASHPTANATAGAHHMMRGRFARRWWLGGQVVGVVIPLLLGIVALITSSDLLGILAGLGAIVGIWFADDALVRAGQAVPLS